MKVSRRERAWYIKKLREEQCGYNTVSRADGLDTEKGWLFLKGIKENQKGLLVFWL